MNFLIDNVMLLLQFQTKYHGGYSEDTCAKVEKQHRHYVESQESCEQPLRINVYSTYRILKAFCIRAYDLVYSISHVLLLQTGFDGRAGSLAIDGECLRACRGIANGSSGSKLAMGRESLRERMPNAETRWSTSGEMNAGGRIEDRPKPICMVMSEYTMP